MTHIRIADGDLMGSAIGVAGPRIGLTSPNPWVGAALAATDGSITTGTTEAPPGRHAEVVALDAARSAGVDPTGATLAVTLEPCDHHGRTPPCTEAIIAAGVARVLVAAVDPDPLVNGRGIDRLRRAGIEVVEGVEQEQAEDQLAPYLHHRRTGRPWVTLKMAATLDGATAAPDGTSQWITGAEARLDVHRLRARHDGVLVGAGTVRDDDPALTVRLPDDDPLAGRSPERIVLGTAPDDARIQPCITEAGPLGEVLDRLGAKGLLSVMIEGGARVAGEFHRLGLVDRYVFYLAPALAGGDDHRGVMSGHGAPTISEFARGSITAIEPLGGDVRIDLTINRDRPGPTGPTGGADVHRNR